MTPIQLAPLVLLASTAMADSLIMPGDRVVLLGDQFAVELADRESFVSTIEAAGATMESRGRCGAESATFVIPGDLEQDDVVLLCLGMIDSLRGDRHLDRFKTELEGILDRMPANQVVLVSPVPLEVEAGDDPVLASNRAIAVGLFADAVRTTAHRNQLHFIDLHGPLRHAESLEGIARDGMHLDANGWSIADREILWQLGLRAEPPDLRISPVTPSHATAHDEAIARFETIEVDLYSGKVGLPPLPGSTKSPPVENEPEAMTWDSALACVQRAAGTNDDHDGVDSLRSCMDVLAGATGRSEEALAALVPIADNAELPMEVRLAAMAAIEDLPAGAAVETARMQTVKITAVPVKMTYDPNRFEVTAGEPVRILLENPDAQPHNLLVCAPGSLRSIGEASEAMGTTAEARASEWVPDSPRVLHVMPMVSQGEVGEVRFIAPARPGRYPIICTYPGHWRMMNGVMLVRSSRP